MGDEGAGTERQHPHADEPWPGYKVLLHLLMKAKRTAVTNTENVAFHAIRKAA